jgi:hypothetical protein
MDFNQMGHLIKFDKQKKSLVKMPIVFLTKYNILASLDKQKWHPTYVPRYLVGR